MKQRTYIVLWIFFAACLPLFAYNNDNSVHYFSQDGTVHVDLTVVFEADIDTLPQNTDSVIVKTDSVWYKISGDSITGEIAYNSADSIVYDIVNKKTYIYTSGNVVYKTYNLKADYIVFDWESKTMYAKITADTSGKKKDPPFFKDGDEQITGDSIAYNFGTQKGKIFDFKTQQGEGYIKVEQAKKTDNDNYYGKDAYYTTCDLDHPHFYIAANKVKIVPDKIAVTGPANLVVADVPTPLFLPFGIFPIHKGQTSGILIPQYGNHYSQGYFLRNGGYYFALSEFYDLSLTGDIYSRGSWGLHAASNYVNRYHFRGSLNVDYAINKYGLSFDPAFSENKNFFIRWNHYQDPKARPNSTFGANVSLGTTNYLTDNSYNSSYLTNQLNSSISYSKTFVGSPFSLSAALRHSQNTQTHQVDLTLPDASLTMNRIYPFKKIAENQKNPLNQFGVSYTLRSQNFVSVPDSMVFDPTTLTKFENGFSHNLSASAPIKLFKYFTLSPSFNYTENWYFQSIRKNYDPDTIINPIYDTAEVIIGYDTTVNLIRTDTIDGFRTARYYNMSLSMSTKLYGQLQFHGKLKAIRHVVSPTVSFNYTPDFSDPKYNYYGTYDPGADLEPVKYSIFEGGIYSGPPSGKVGSIGFSLGNNVEMKVYSKKDSVNHEKKIKLIESLNLSTAYNLAADSLQLSDIGFNGYTTLFDKVRLNVSGSFDPYVLDSNGRNINIFEWDKNHRIGRFNGANVSLSTAFKSKRIENSSFQTLKGTDEEREDVWSSPDNYIDFDVPWSVNIAYSLRIANVPTIAGADSLSTTQTATFSGDLNVTPNWKVQFTSGYDFELYKFTYTSLDIYRDLHCWEMGFKWVPFGIRRSYMFNLNVKSSVLQDLKLSRKKDWSEY